LKFKFLQEQLLIFIGFGMSGQDQFASIRCRQMHIDHLHQGKLLQHCSGRQSMSQGTTALLQGDLQAIGQKGDGDMRLDPLIR